MGEIKERSEKKDAVQTEVDLTEKYRLGAAVSFASMLLVIGIPLWWKTTEVHRAYMPFDDIHNLVPSSTLIGISIFVHSSKAERIDRIIRSLDDSISRNYNHFDIAYRPMSLKLDESSYTVIENNKSLHPHREGELWLVEVSDLPRDVKVLVSTHRIIYFSPKAEAHDLATVLNEWVLVHRTIQSKITSIISPQSLNETDERLNSLRASLNYDVILTIINSDPERINVVWDVSSDLKRYFQPLMTQLSEISVHTLKSQWLYLVDFGEVPKKDENGTFLLDHSQLPHIITPLEKKLGSGISKHPCVHLILYTPPCKTAPLQFISSTGSQVSSMISPHWGAVQLLNPSKENCENRTTLHPDTEKVLGVFIAQFHSLLGVGYEDLGPDIQRMPMSGPLLCDWELDNLYRVRTVEQITSASLTLQSLSKLLGEISNIVINGDVAQSISDAVDNVYRAKRALAESKLIEALRFSRAAFHSAETAFSDPSLLALLYFPDDQKYAVYIPLFLPIMIPVLMSLKKILYNASMKIAQL